MSAAVLLAGAAALLVLSLALLLRRTGEVAGPAVARSWIRASAGEPVGVAAEALDTARAQVEGFSGLAAMIERADMRLSPNQLLARAAAGGLLVAFGAAIVAGAIGAFAAVVLTPLVTRAVLRIRAERRRKAFADELADTVQAVAAAMRAGYGLSAAVAMVADDAGEPMASELHLVVQAERLGVPFDVALDEAVRRTGNRDLGQLALVAVLQREVGGNGAEAMDRIVDSVRHRDELRRLIRTLTAQAQLTRWVLTLLPLVLVAALLVVGDGYLDPLVSTGVGRLLVIGAAGAVCVGSFWIKSVTTIEV